MFPNSRFLGPLSEGKRHRKVIWMFWSLLKNAESVQFIELQIFLQKQLGYQSRSDLCAERS